MTTYEEAVKIQKKKALDAKKEREAKRKKLVGDTGSYQGMADQGNKGDM